MEENHHPAEEIIWALQSRLRRGVLHPAVPPKIMERPPGGERERLVPASPEAGRPQDALP